MAEAPVVRARTGFVLDFADIDATMLPTVGGKAANLGELTRATLPVPPGLCVTTDAYGQVAASGGLDDILAALAETAPDDVTALSGFAGRARAALLAAPVPAPIIDAITSGYARLSEAATEATEATDTPVAVRSSATAEDLPFASFAGQQDTYLNVVGRDAVLAAVVRCWASLWTDRAVVYRATNGIDHRTVRLAVVIQRMVAAEVAGVLFTANPVTGRRRQAVIDASPGLGEAVVSGAVNPDHFVVDTDTGEIVSRRLGDKRLVILARPGGGTEHVERPATGDACVTDEQVRALVALGKRVEAHYGRPQDTEWAIDTAGTLWLTQARPITNLYPLPANAPADALRVYFCFSVAQGLYRPITPLGRAAFRLLATSVTRMFGLPVADPLAGPTRYAEAGQRLFVDVTPALRSRVGRAAMPRILDVMEARSAAVLRGLFDEPRLSVTRTSRWPVLRRVLRVAARYRIPLVAAHALARPGAALRRFDRIGGRLDARLTLPASATPAERLDLVERVLAAETVPLAPRILPAAAAGFVMFGLAGRLLGADARPGDLQTVLRGLPHNVTTEMDLELWRLASRVRADDTSAALLLTGSVDELADRFHAGTLPPVVQDGLTGFLHQYGHRAVAEIDIGLPRWSEDPRHVLGILANYLRLDDPTLAPDALFERGAREAEEMIETLVGRARRRGRLRAGLVRFALRRTRQLAGIRELPKYYLVLALAGVRRQLTIVGADLARRGLIEDAGDVSFLDLIEIRSGDGDLRETVAARREAYETELRRRHVPRVLLSDGTEPEMAAAPAASDAALIGTPASAGTVTGTARVILDPVGAHLEPGEILVAPSTDPGWTPLFLTAGGLVMEMGGANSHGAVVAREYGIPAVVGVPDATGRISTGQQVTVDGGAGTVTV
jgi:phosphohistidine swiveling domain-containing protein